MIVDNQLYFSEEQSITTGSGSGSAPGVRSTNVVFLSEERRIGNGEELFLVVLCTLAMTSSGSNDALDVNLYADTAEGFGSATLVAKVGTFPQVSAAGTRLVYRIPPDALTKTYLGLYYISQTSDALTQGKFTAFITKDVDAYAAYPDAVTIA